MPTLRKVVSALAAGATSDNLAEGLFQYLPGPAAVVVYAAADAAAVKLDLTLGNVVDTNDFDIPVKAATVGPLRNEDLCARAVGVGGDLVTVKVRNSGAAATNIRVLIDILPV